MLQGEKVLFKDSLGTQPGLATASESWTHSSEPQSPSDPGPRVQDLLSLHLELPQTTEVWPERFCSF